MFLHWALHENKTCHAIASHASHVLFTNDHALIPVLNSTCNYETAFQHWLVLRKKVGVEKKFSWKIIQKEIKFLKTREACNLLQREGTRLCHEQKAINAMSKKVEHVHLSSIVNLSVGSRRFTASLQTLIKDPDSILAAMFSAKFEVKPLEDEALFIDRDGKHFRFMLNYLRTGNELCQKEIKIDELVEEVLSDQRGSRRVSI